MSTQTLPAPTKPDTDDDVCHLYCCDPNQGICGVRGIAAEIEIEDPKNLCVVCDDLDQYPCEICGWTP